MKNASNSLERLFVQLIRGQDGCALAATINGDILEATGAGWRLVENWWRCNGRAEMGDWLHRYYKRADPQPLVVDLAGRRYRLTAKLLPFRDSASGLPAYNIHGEELLAGGSFSLAYVRKAYGLTAAETELLNLHLLRHTPRQIAAALDLPPEELKTLSRSLRRKLTRRKDRLVRFAVKLPRFAKE